MRTLRGELFNSSTLVNSVEVTYDEDPNFFTAFVEVCYKLNIDIPIWTMNEDLLLKEKGAVFFRIDDNEIVLKITGF